MKECNRVRACERACVRACVPVCVPVCDSGGKTEQANRERGEGGKMRS